MFSYLTCPMEACPQSLAKIFSGIASFTNPTSVYVYIFFLVSTTVNPAACCPRCWIQLILGSKSVQHGLFDLYKLPEYTLFFFRFIISTFYLPNYSANTIFCARILVYFVFQVLLCSLNSTF